MSSKKLTAKQEKFIDEYLKDLNATQAAIRAGYSKKTAQEASSRLLSNVMVSSEIAKRRRALSESCGVTRERIVKEMARLALFTAKSLYDDDGNLLPINKLSDDAAAAISGIDVVTIGNSDVGVGQITKYRMPDKNKALENLAKILGHFDKEKQKDQQDGVYIFEVRRATKDSSVTN